MKPIIIHSKTKSGKRFTAVAVVKEESDKRISVGIALCSNKDHFNKAMGRIIALGRATKGEYRNRGVLGMDRNIDTRLYIVKPTNGKTTKKIFCEVKEMLETFIENN